MDLQKVLGESAASPNNHLADGNLEMLGFGNLEIFHL